MQTKIKTAAEITAMRESGRMLASVLERLQAGLAVGMSTKDLSLLAGRELKALGGQPAFLGYQGFPDILCVSLNNEVVHGIPRPDVIIKDGDIVSLDFGVIYQGMITDAARSVIAGRPLLPRHSDLLKHTEQAMQAGINVVRGGVRAGDIGAAVQAVLDRFKYGIVRDLVGHAVGHELHEDPNIPNYGRPGSGPFLQVGMTIAIEPMSTLGTDRVAVAGDGWTILTADGSLSAHFENTVLITEDGAEVLTAL